MDQKSELDRVLNGLTPWVSPLERLLPSVSAMEGLTGLDGSTFRYANTGNLTITLPWHPTEEKEPKVPMRGFFAVFILDPKTEKVWFSDYFVAQNETSARLKAVVAAKLVDDPENYDFIVRHLGAVRPRGAG